IRMTGNTSMMNVSAAGGLSDRRPKSQRNGHSGRGLAPGMVGSGGISGPLGPTSAAIATTMITATVEQMMSLVIASPANGSPDFNSCSYSASYVFGSTTFPGTGGVLTPSFTTSQRCADRKI